MQRCTLEACFDRPFLCCEVLKTFVFPREGQRPTPRILLKDGSSSLIHSPPVRKRDSSPITGVLGFDDSRPSRRDLTAQGSIKEHWPQTVGDVPISMPGHDHTASHGQHIFPFYSTSLPCGHAAMQYNNPVDGAPAGPLPSTHQEAVSASLPCCLHPGEHS